VVIQATARKGIAIWNLRGCAKCGGDLYREDNVMVCLQCSHEVAIKKAGK
jgi:hypothetical protein